MTELRRIPLTSDAPKVGFVSLGCPKALVDSEQILTQLRAEGYETAKSYEGADLVIVNTCGFIDAAVQESLDAIGEALAENGRVIVTGCLGAKKDAQGDDIIMKVHPKVLAVTGPHALAEVMDSVHFHLPKPHEPFIDLGSAYRLVGGFEERFPRGVPSIRGCSSLRVEADATFGADVVCTGDVRVTGGVRTIPDGAHLHGEV